MSPRAIILGGTGAIGTATAELLAAEGWLVDLTGRDPSRMPSGLLAQGARFHQMPREDAAGFGKLLGPGADLVVDLLAYSAEDVQSLLPYLVDVGSVVLASSRAVYTDSAGRHINGDEPPQFPVPMSEASPLLPPAAPGSDPFSREGYGPSKAAMEQAALSTGLPITVMRLSKVHGPWARNARTRAIVNLMLAGAEKITLARRGESIDHLSAAANVAQLVRTAASLPGSRVLNAADPDPLTAREIFEAIAEAAGWAGELELLEPGEPGGEHPWNAAHPIVLDTTAAAELGYRPVGAGRDLIKQEVQWVISGPPA